VGTAIQTGRSRFRFPKVSLDFLTDIMLPVTLWPWGLPGIFPGVKATGS
jgi:hypothetical protein